MIRTARMLGVVIALTTLSPIPSTAASAAAAGRIEGRMELVASGSQRIERGEVADGVVYFLPDAGTAPPPPGRFSVDTRSKGFSPAVLAVPVGSTVSFPNSDTILHNVYSRSGANAFDLGFYGSGQTRQHVFARAGLVLVNCSVHQTMRANILVLSTPHYTRPDREGRFRLDALPAGQGTLVFWHPRGTATSLKIAAPATVPAQRIVATKPPLGLHRHDHGRRP